MFSTSYPVLASGYVPPGILHALGNALGGLSGAALAVAVIGALIGWVASLMIDWLPGPVGILAGIVGIFLIASVV